MESVTTRPVRGSAYWCLASSGTEYHLPRAINVSPLTPRAGKLFSSLSWISTKATFISSSSLAKRCSSVRPNAGSTALMGLLQNTLKQQQQGYLRIEINTEQKRTCWIWPLLAPLWGTVKAKSVASARACWIHLLLPGRQWRSLGCVSPCLYL